MARAEPAAGVAVEVFVEQNQIAPMRIGCVFLLPAVAGARPILVRQKNARESARDFLRHLLQVHHVARAGRAFDLEVVAVEVVVAFERLDDQIIDREPDRTAPIRVTAEEIARSFARHVIDSMLFIARVEDVRTDRDESARPSAGRRARETRSRPACSVGRASSRSCVGMASMRWQTRQGTVRNR